MVRTKTKFLCMSFFISVTCVSLSMASEKQETPHLEFVTEYIRQLAAIEQMRSASDQEMNKAVDDRERITISIHWNTLSQLELQTQISVLETMNLKEPFERLIPNIIDFYRQKIALHQRMSTISSTVLAGPEPGVNYGELASELPKIRANLDFIDRALFRATPLVFAALIDQKPDSQDHLSHLNINKQERRELIGTINNEFGAALDQKDQNYTVSTASILKDSLLKYKCSDEPWE